MNRAAVSCWRGWNKKNALCYVLKRRGGGKENSLVLFYVVCAQLEPKRMRRSGGEKGGWGTRRGEGLKIS